MLTISALTLPQRFQLPVSMLSSETVLYARWLLFLWGTQMSLHHRNLIPQTGSVLVVSNHRSFMDPIVLTAAVGRPIRFACHHYMGQVPLLRELVTTLGAFPLEDPQHRPQEFFKQANALLANREMVGIFPEGAKPMVKVTPPLEIGSFQRGFAHLALRSDSENLAVLPLAIHTSEEALIQSLVPLKALSWFDPSEPLFDQPGWHPVVFYRRVNVLVGRPYWITPQLKQAYQGKQARDTVYQLTHYCEQEITKLLR
ncbi:MAG: lysophospholipid acyltransferase family protein [Microcoleaceae cyanobacterium]